ncbi:MAG: competence/damage-inducible protein A [Nitrospiraceae bacterium]
MRPDHTTAEIIAVGTELLLGGRTDTNSLSLTDWLAHDGYEVRYKTIVGDREEDIVAAIRVAAARAGVILITGGLGPTLDDRTRQALAAVTRRPLRRHLQAARQLAAWLRARGRPATEAQQIQAMLPRGASVLKNTVGSAPGCCLEWRGSLIGAMPGVPTEMAAMFEQGLRPLLRRRRAKTDSTVIRRQLLTYGLPEADLEAQVLDLIPDVPGVAFGTLASALGVSITLTYTPPRDGQPRRVLRRIKTSATATQVSPSQVIDRTLLAMRTRLGSLVYGEGTVSMEDVVGHLLRERRLTLATAESCTGGLIGHRLTQVPGASAYYNGGAVCYSNALKTSLLGVPEALFARHGAVSAEVASAMADGVRVRTGSQIAVSVTGIAGPGGGSSEKPVGTVYIGLAVEGQPTQTERYQFHGPRDTIKTRAAQTALNWLRLTLTP